MSTNKKPTTTPKTNHRPIYTESTKPAHVQLKKTDAPTEVLSEPVQTVSEMLAEEAATPLPPIPPPPPPPPTVSVLVSDIDFMLDQFKKMKVADQMAPHFSKLEYRRILSNLKQKLESIKKQ